MVLLLQTLLSSLRIKKCKNNNMKKQDKKIENQIRNVLHQVCESALDRIEGFVWLTHLVNYKAFPQSLIVVCVFESEAELAQAIALEQDNDLRNAISQSLGSINIKLKDSNRSIRFDTEEACAEQDNGQWSKRFDHYQLH
jgi:hypothetical protein